MDPDILARDLRHSKPDCAEALSGWAAETYPELFDVHAEPAESARESVIGNVPASRPKLP